MAIPPTGVILAAAGEGRRLGSRNPKALIPFHGRPLFLHSLRTFASLPFIRQIVVVLPPTWVDPIQRKWSRELVKHRVTALVPGGKRRQDSVRAGLEILSTPLVLVHDAARPLIAPAAILDVSRAAARHGAAVLAALAVDTIKIADGRGRVRETPDRKRVWHAETPQVSATDDTRRCDGNKPAAPVGPPQLNHNQQ